MNEFWSMGGHGAYIWPAFAVVVAVLLGLLVASITRYRASVRELERLESRVGRRKVRS